MLDKSGSTVPKELWNAKSHVKVDDLIKYSENWTESPLKRFLDIIEKKIANSKDVVLLTRKLSSQDSENGNLDAIEDEIIENFFTKEV